MSRSVHRRRVRLAEAEEIATAAADDGQELLFLPALRLTHQHNDFATVKGLGRRLSFIE